MIFKWIFTILAIMWLYRVLQPMLRQAAPPPEQPRRPGRPEGSVEVQKREDDADADFTDYEEIR